MYDRLSKMRRRDEDSDGARHVGKGAPWVPPRPSSSDAAAEDAQGRETTNGMEPDL